MSEANIEYISQPDEVDELKRRVAKLEAVIKKYAGHITFPPHLVCQIGDRIEGGISPCTCGYSAAMK